MTETVKWGGLGLSAAELDIPAREMLGNTLENIYGRRGAWGT